MSPNIAVAMYIEFKCNGNLDERRTATLIFIFLVLYIQYDINVI